MTTDQLITQALSTLTPDPGFHKPNRQQTAEATARAAIATAQALSDIAAALNRIADNTTPTPGVSLRTAIHHST